MVLEAISHERNVIFGEMAGDMNVIFQNMKLFLKEHGLYKERDQYWKRSIGSFDGTDTHLKPPILGKEEALAFLTTQRKKKFPYKFDEESDEEPSPRSPKTYWGRRGRFSNIMSIKSITDISYYICADT